MHTHQKALIAMLLLICFAAFSAISVASDHNASKAAPSKYVGTYFGRGTTSIVTFHADGTLAGTAANMFTEDPNTLTLGSKSTPALGVLESCWRQPGQGY